MWLPVTVRLQSLVLYIQPLVAADAFGHPVIYLTVVPAYQQLSHFFVRPYFHLSLCPLIASHLFWHLSNYCEVGVALPSLREADCNLPFTAEPCLIAFTPPPRQDIWLFFFLSRPHCCIGHLVEHCREIWNRNAHWPCQQAEWLCRPCPKWERTWRAWSWWQMVCVGLLPPCSGYKPRKRVCIKRTQISVVFQPEQRSIEQWEIPLSWGESKPPL